MTTIIELIVLMVGLFFVGRRSKEMGMRQYLIIILVTSAQIGLVVLYLFTVERPPAL
jgi:hypothetical protein